MRIKFFKELFFGVIIIFCIHLYRNWNTYYGKLPSEPTEVNFSQLQLDVKPIKSLPKEPIWFVKTENPTVAFQIVFVGEGQRNFSDKPQILSLLDKTLFDGAGEYDATKLKQMFVYNNININVDFNSDDAVVSVYTVVDNFELAADLLGDILTKAHLRGEKIEANKKAIIDSLEQSKFSSRGMCRDLLNRTLYKKGHPYRSTIADSIARIPSYTREDVQKCYDKVFTVKNAEIVVAGNLEEPRILKVFNKLFSKLSVKKNDFKKYEGRTDIEESGKEFRVNVDSPSSVVYFVLPGAKKGSADVYPLRLANMAFGGSEAAFNTLLYKRVRDKLGLVYGIQSSTSETDLQSMITGVAFTSAENTDKVIAEERSCVKDFAEKGISQEDLKYYKTCIYSKDILASAVDIVDFLISARIDGVPLERINDFLYQYYNLTLEDVNRIIKKYFVADKMLFCVGGKSKDKEKRNENQ
jgi:predicted Zn-dependent peptidase